MHFKIKAAASLITLLLVTAACGLCASSGGSFPFLGEVTANGINLRADSSVSSAVICKVNKGDAVTVRSESFDWYKVTLPKDAPAFIKSNLVVAVGSRSARVARNKVNIRLEPSESSPIIGRAQEDEVVNILGMVSGWYRIEPSDSCYGWLNKKFVKPAAIEKEISPPEPVATPPQETPKPLLPEIKAPAVQEPAPEKEASMFYGIVKPYGRVFNRTATHKLFTQDKKIFFLKGNRAILDGITFHKVKISGKLIPGTKEKYPVIEVDKVQILD